MAEVRLEVSNLHFSYDGDDGPRVTAIEEVSFSLKSSEFVSIIGPSGCGKSTLSSTSSAACWLPTALAVASHSATVHECGVSIAQP